MNISNFDHWFLFLDQINNSSVKKLVAPSRGVAKASFVKGTSFVESLSSIGLKNVQSKKIPKKKKRKKNSITEGGQAPTFFSKTWVVLALNSPSPPPAHHYLENAVFTPDLSTFTL